MIGLSKQISTYQSRFADDYPRGRVALRTRPYSSPSVLPTVFIVVSNDNDRQKLEGVLEKEGRPIEGFRDGRAFMERCHDDISGCLLVDAQLQGMDGLDLLREVTRAGFALPTVVLTGRGRVPTAVAAMRAGATDVVEKPVGDYQLRISVRRALGQSRQANRFAKKRKAALKLLSDLTPRQMEVLQMVLAGHPSKNIAADLGISQRTVESHRAYIMQKTGAVSLPALARMAVIANWYGDFPH